MGLRKGAARSVSCESTRVVFRTEVKPEVCCEYAMVVVPFS